jgi:hypothetical protein
MATIAPQGVTYTALNATYTAVSGGGDKFLSTGKELLHFKNTDVAPRTVTFATVLDKDGLTMPDRTITVPASGERFVGNLATGLHRDADGYVNMTYDAATGLSVAILRPAS